MATNDGLRLKSWRLGKKMTQAQLTKKLDVGVNLVSSYETGNRNGKKVKVPKVVLLACDAIEHNLEGI